MTESTGSDRRPTTLAFLRRHGADTTPHLFGDLLTHLLGVEALARAWGGSELLALAALGHATYGTDGFEPCLLELDRRDELSDTIGPDVEAFVYYASCDRSTFYPQLTSTDLDFGDLRFQDRFTHAETAPRPEDVTRFVDLTFARSSWPRRRRAGRPSGPGWPSSAGTPSAGPAPVITPVRSPCWIRPAEHPVRDDHLIP
jgi:hypothetical protein